MGTHSFRSFSIAAARLFVLACVVLAVAAVPAGATTLPSGFSEQTAFSGLVNPTAIEFAPDGRVFVAEKSGLIKMFSGPGDSTAQTVADLRTNVHNFWDRGLLDIALDPEFAESPYIYALYTYDAANGGSAPRWGSPGAGSDPCPNPPGATGDGCEVGGRLSKLRLEGSSAGPEQVLIQDWCQQYPSHSIGGLAFDSEGALYVSGGDGASFNWVDYGQDGSPVNPCGDPPAGRGGALTPPRAEGGALRSQDIRTGSDPTGLDGSIIRVDPGDGSPLPDNPNADADTANERRIIGYGLRNPFRITVRPGTDEIWSSEVGWTTWEEVNRQDSGEVVNYGWPCYEGPGRQGGYDGANLDLCEDLYDDPGAQRSPYLGYRHSSKVVPGESCPTGSSSPAGVAFNESGGPFPNAYDGALFFADYSRDCIWAMKLGPGGDPDPARVETFAAAADNPVNLEIGEDGALYYPDFDGGRIRAIRYFAANQPPTAVLSADPTSGSAPLEVALDASGSSDPDAGDALGYAWDLDDDGDFDDGTGAELTRTFSTAGTHRVTVRVSDGEDADTAMVSIDVDNAPPGPTIDAPGPVRKWSVGELVAFSGSAQDPDQGSLPPSALDWRLILHHCPSNCHTHPIRDFEGVASGSFAAPDHEYPSHLELELTATDDGGLSAKTSVRLDPKTVDLRLQSDPAGTEVSLNAASAPAPLEAEVIAGSANSISAAESFTEGGTEYRFDSWQHGGARVQNVTAPASDATYTATYEPVSESRTLRFAPVADASIYSDRPGANLGGADSLEVDGSPGKSFLARFDVSGVNGDRITGARLRLHAVNGSSRGGEVHATANGWGEGSVSWSSAPAAGLKLASLGEVAVGGTYEVDVGSAVNGDGSVSFRVDSDYPNGADYASREAEAALVPELILDVAPSGSSTHSFEPTDDASIYADQPETGFGDAPAVETDGLPRKDFLLRFEVSDLGGEPVTGARLELRNVSPSPSGGSFALSDPGWTEETVDWSNAPAAGAPFTALGPVSRHGDYAVDLGGAVDGEGTYSIRVSSSDSDGADYVSKEGPAGLGPRLVVETGEGPPPPPPALHFAPDADASLYADEPGASLGGGDTLEVDGSPEKDALLRFTVDGVGGQPVSGARLRLHAVNPSPSGGRFHRTDAGWQESAVGWGSAPAAEGTPLATLGSVSVGSWYEIDVSSIIDGDGTYAFRADSLNDNGADYSSREAGPVLAPELVVDLGAATLAAPVSSGLRARVVRVLGPRTIRVRIAEDGRRTVRLSGLRAPRSRCLARKGRRARTRKLGRGERIRLLPDPRAGERDRAGRYLRYVVRRGADPARPLLRRGLIRPRARRSFERRAEYRSLARTKRARRAARAATRGCRR